MRHLLIDEMLTLWLDDHTDALRLLLKSLGLFLMFPDALENSYPFFVILICSVISLIEKLNFSKDLRLHFTQCPYLLLPP